MPPPRRSTGQGSCCGCLLSLGITALLLWLAYRPIVPRYYLVSFEDNHTLSLYVLEIENKCWQMGVYHDEISLSLSPGNATSSVPAFYQGHKKTAEKSGSFTGGTGVRTNGTRAFQVGVESGYRYKVWWWKTGHHGVSVTCDVEVGRDGRKTAEKGIRLTSAATTTTTTATTCIINYMVFAVVAGVLILY